MVNPPEPFPDLDWSPERARALGDSALEMYEEWLRRLPDLPVDRGRNAAEVSEAVHLDVPAEGMRDEELLEYLRKLVFDYSMYPGHPGFLAYIVGGGTVPGAIADLVAAGINQNLGGWRLSPGATEIELHLVRFFTERFGLPQEAGGASCLRWVHCQLRRAQGGARCKGRRWVAHWWVDGSDATRRLHVVRGPLRDHAGGRHARDRHGLRSVDRGGRSLPHGRGRAGESHRGGCRGWSSTLLCDREPGHGSDRCDRSARAHRRSLRTPRALDARRRGLRRANRALGRTPRFGGWSRARRLDRVRPAQVAVHASEWRLHTRARRGASRGVVLVPGRLHLREQRAHGQGCRPQLARPPVVAQLLGPQGLGVALIARRRYLRPAHRSRRGSHAIPRRRTLD